MTQLPCVWSIGERLPPPVAPNAYSCSGHFISVSSHLHITCGPNKKCGQLVDRNSLYEFQWPNARPVCCMGEQYTNK